MSHLDQNQNFVAAANMNNGDYNPQQRQQQQQWIPVQEHYPPYSAPSSHSLSLNLSSLSVTSPSSASPINPSPVNTTSTPVSPSVNPYPSTQYQFDAYPPDDPQQSYDPRRTPGVSSNSRSSSTTSTPSQHLPRKRSFTSTPVLEEPDLLYDDAHDAPMDLAPTAPYDDIDMRYAADTPAPSSAGPTANGSPVDGSDTGEPDIAGSGPPGGGVGGTMNVLGKPLATNNFVTKLYQMINDAKSAHYIAWTELGTSFVVSNVGEFSRSILGSHFKHNNFSSFVRQLNMYGFHKINRTPRAQRTSTDAQTWEFSHHKFLRGRPDLLDEIKRKALEPDPAMKHRVELPGEVRAVSKSPVAIPEVAAQLGAMRDENQRMWNQLNHERKRTERLTGALQRLWEVVGTRVGGYLLSPDDSPNIYITPSPASTPSGSAKFAPPPLSMSNVHMGGLHTMHSPLSGSPTQSEFAPPTPNTNGGNGGAPPLSRQQSFQHVSYLRGDASPLPGSPAGELYDDTAGGEQRLSTKRARIATEDDGHHHHSHHHHPYSTHGSAPPSAHPDLGGLSNLTSLPPPPARKASRARSDSAPLGYGFGVGGVGGGMWGGGGRPRSGSGLAGRVPNIALRAGGGMGGQGQGQQGNGVLSVPSNAPR
ncbi:hypothetical protein DXG01_015296 [Tephrocybe rancida]|nr:hypothetical protein DXG01_015296 [Tephrocybe rancida]